MEFAVLLEQAAPGWIPHNVTSPVSKPLHGSTGPDRGLLQHGLSTESQHLLGIHLLQRGVLPVLQVDLCSCYLHGCRGTAVCPWSAPWAAGDSLCFEHPLTLLLNLVPAGLFLSHTLTSVFSGCNCSALKCCYLPPTFILLFQRFCQRSWSAQIWMVLGPSLELAGTIGSV